MKREWTAKQKEQIISDYTEKGLTCAEIGKQYHAKADTIGKYLKEWGVPLKGNKTKNRLLKENYFSNIDCPQKAYFLGLLFADGSVVLDNKRSASISLELQEEDKEVLVILQKELNSTGTLYYNKRSNRDNGTYTFSVRCNQMASDLAKYNIVPNKTYITEKVIPPEKFLIDFLRGYIDGDGSLYYSGNYWHLSITGHNEQVIMNFQQLLNNLILNKKPNKLTYYNKVYKAIWNGEQAIELMKILYTNAEIYLPRKYKKAMMATTIMS